MPPLRVATFLRDAPLSACPIVSVPLTMPPSISILLSSALPFSDRPTVIAPLTVPPLTVSLLPEAFAVSDCPTVIFFAFISPPDTAVIFPVTSPFSDKPLCRLSICNVPPLIVSLLPEAFASNVRPAVISCAFISPLDSFTVFPVASPLSEYPPYNPISTPPPHRSTVFPVTWPLKDFPPYTL